MKRSVAMFGALIWGLLGLGCGESAQRGEVPKPPPLPSLPVAVPASESAEGASERADEPKAGALARREPTKAKVTPAREPSGAQAGSKRAQAPKVPTSSQKQANKSSVSASVAAPAKPGSSSPPASAAPKATATSKVTIPRTEHVSVQIPAGLQADLDRDPRMQPWANQVLSVIDRCHAQTRSATGTVVVSLTMHEHERPDADLGNVPGALSPLVACATGGLLRTKMPLFTGREGQRYTLRIVFQ